MATDSANSKIFDTEVFIAKQTRQLKADKAKLRGQITVMSREHQTEIDAFKDLQR